MNYIVDLKNALIKSNTKQKEYENKIIEKND